MLAWCLCNSKYFIFGQYCFIVGQVINEYVLSSFLALILVSRIPTSHKQTPTCSYSSIELRENDPYWCNYFFMVLNFNTLLTMRSMFQTFTFAYIFLITCVVASITFIGDFSLVFHSRFVCSYHYCNSNLIAQNFQITPFYRVVSLMVQKFPTFVSEFRT